MSTTRYDFAGQITQTTSATGAVTTSVYDPYGRAESATRQVRAVGAQPAITATTLSTYTALGFPKTTTDPALVVTTAVYNSLGLTLSTQTGTLAAATTLFDGVGRPRKVTNPDGSYTVTTYDPAGRATRTELFGSDNVSSEFTVLVNDGNGNVTRSTNARGAQTVYLFDVLNRLESVTVPTDTVAGNGVVYTYAYDQASNLTRVTDGTARVTRYTFNVWNLPEATLEPAATGDTEATRLWRVAYNAGGQALTETHPGAKTISRTFNGLGLPESETASQPATARCPNCGATTLMVVWSVCRIRRRRWC